jgi:CubicO group peptidase (beta-lactamase class C family)
MENEKFEWRAQSCEDVLSTGNLENAIQEHSRREPLNAFLVIRHDTIAYEWYNTGCSLHTPHWTASLTKSLVGATSFLLALEDGIIMLDQPAYHFIPEWRSDPDRSRVTLRHLITHSSGLADAKPKEDQARWTGKFWQYPEHYLFAKEKSPVIFEPGSHDLYSNPGMALLSYCLTKALMHSPEKDIKTLLRNRVMRHLGIPDDEWLLDWDDPLDPLCRNPEIYGNGKPALVDGLEVYATWGGSSFSPDATARIGRLMLRHGIWEGKNILSEDIVREALKPHGATKLYDANQRPRTEWGLGWRLNTNGCFHSLPKDAFIGAGRGIQILLVIPSLDMIVVRFGQHTGEHEFWNEVEQYLFDPIMDAVR